MDWEAFGKVAGYVTAEAVLILVAYIALQLRRLRKAIEDAAREEPPAPAIGAPVEAPWSPPATHLPEEAGVPSTVISEASRISPEKLALWRQVQR